MELEGMIKYLSKRNILRKECEMICLGISMNITRQQNITLGIFYAVISALAFALMSVLVKQIDNSLPISMLIFFALA